jgi:hypothetical protein
MLRTPSSHPVSKGVVIVIPIRKIHLHKLVYEDFADAVVICDIRLDQTTTLLQKKQCKYALMKQIAAATKNTRQ